MNFFKYNPEVGRIVFDTNVCSLIANCPNKIAVMGHLRTRYKVAASANTVYELLLGLCRSTNGQYFQRDQERFMVAFGHGSLTSAKFLDHGLAFALKHGTRITTAETGMGATIFRGYTKLVLKARSLDELRVNGVRWSGSKGRILKCEVIEADFDNAKLFYRTDVRRPLLDRIRWAKNLAAVVNVNLTDVQAATFANSLDGLYAYEKWLRTAVSGRFNPEKNVNDRMDMHQRFYLADPSIEFITDEEKIRERIGATQQSQRVVLLKDFPEPRRACVVTVQARTSGDHEAETTQTGQSLSVAPTHSLSNIPSCHERRSAWSSPPTSGS